MPPPIYPISTNPPPAPYVESYQRQLLDRLEAERSTTPPRVEQQRATETALDQRDTLTLSAEAARERRRVLDEQAAQDGQNQAELLDAQREATEANRTAGRTALQEALEQTRLQQEQSRALSQQRAEQQAALRDDRTARRESDRFVQDRRAEDVAGQRFEAQRATQGEAVERANQRIAEQRYEEERVEQQLVEQQLVERQLADQQFVQQTQLQDYLDERYLTERLAEQRTLGELQADRNDAQRLTTQRVQQTDASEELNAVRLAEARESDATQQLDDQLARADARTETQRILAERARNESVQAYQVELDRIREQAQLDYVRLEAERLLSDQALASQRQAEFDNQRRIDQVEVSTAARALSEAPPPSRLV